MEAASDNANDFVGQLRSRLGSTQDVRLVYSDADADLIVSVLASRDTSTDGRELGYHASVVIDTPCAYSYSLAGDKKADTLRKSVDHLIELGPDMNTVLSSVAAALDVGDFDQIRREHSNLSKFYSP